MTSKECYWDRSIPSPFEIFLNFVVVLVSIGVSYFLESGWLILIFGFLCLGLVSYKVFENRNRIRCVILDEERILFSKWNSGREAVPYTAIASVEERFRPDDNLDVEKRFLKIMFCDGVKIFPEGLKGIHIPSHYKDYIRLRNRLMKKVSKKG